MFRLAIYDIELLDILFKPTYLCITFYKGTLPFSFHPNSNLKIFTNTVGMMHSANSPIEALPTWVKLNGIIFDNVTVSPMTDDKGLGVIVSGENAEPRDLLMTVPRDLILSLENVWIFAKSDHHLREVLESAGEYSRVPCPSASWKVAVALIWS